MTGTGRRRLLVIDDDSDVLNMLVLALQGGYEVRAAKDGEEGLRAATLIYPDLILCDVIMPAMSGVEVLRHLHLHPTLNSVPVILMTGNQFDAQTQALFQQHPSVRGYIKKPCGVRDVLAAVASVLGTPAPCAPPPAAAPASGPGTPPPAGPSGSGPARPPARQAKPARRYNILIADDDVSFFQFLGLVIPKEDLITQVKTGAEALAKLQASQPDLILLDMMMPDMTGVELLRAMQKDPRLGKIPVIVMTGLNMNAKDASIMKRDFSNLREVLPKPCDIKTLRSTLDLILIRDLA